MRALRIHRHGGPEALVLEDAPLPVPGKGQTLVRVKAASINPIDWKMRSGMMAKIFPFTFPRTLGRDCAGLDETGNLIAGVGDPRIDGTHAEFALLSENQFARVPAGLDAAAAASLCVSGLSAYTPLVEIAGVIKGRKILIHAGAGGVGSLAIQIARHLGAEVHATASAANRDYCATLGASRVIDYRNEGLKDDFYDVVLDTIGGRTHLDSIKALKTGGMLVALSAAPIPKISDPVKVKVVMAQIQATRERLKAIFAWASSGVIRPQVTQRFSLEEGAAAYAASESGHARGKIVVVP